ncbi:DUF721 domain-containing protein [Vampirovibrio chlorellavorus]|uniref:DUF721 domain-containing protein n=1 Tax=Vampirovibrio chlorellavorus TaxID=758823 RepID=UPI0026ED257D|nr:DUF721 domain-containing protein [Vampirovibrio chlorellavorus]
MNEPPRSTYRKKPTRVGSLAAFSEVLPQICQNLELDKKVNEMALLALWPQQVSQLAGATLGQNTRAVRLRKQGYQTVLFVKVANAALASELTFHIPVLLNALNGYKAQTGLTVDRIQVSVGSLK